MNTKAGFSNGPWKAPNKRRPALPIILREIALVAFLLAGVGFTAIAQDFQNLDFESASVTPPGPGQVPFSSALPGWTGYCGTNVQTWVNYNQEWLDSAGISLFDTDCTIEPVRGLIQGSYCVCLYSGVLYGTYSDHVETSIAQAGQVPAYARSILFDFSPSSNWGDGRVNVTFNGNPIALAVLTTQPNFVVFGGDVSQFAGQIGELRFTAPSEYIPGQVRRSIFLMDDVRFSTTPLAAAPVILTPPRSQAWNMGSTVDFVVSATGYPAPAFQWWFNATSVILGATDSILELTNVQFSQSGAYTVVISNVYGVVTSPPALLTVHDPFITNQPLSQSIDAKQIASVSVGAGGTKPFSFQWLKNGVGLNDGGNLFGAKTSTLTLSNVLGGDAGAYSVIVSNSYSRVTSQLATLTVRDPLILSQRVSQTVDPGGTAVLNVVAAGTAPFSYQWSDAGVRLNDGANISGAQTATLTLANVLSGEADAYWVVVGNSYGSVTSQVAFVSVNQPLYSVLHSFNGSDGVNPEASLVLSGTTLYGTTYSGGGSGQGTVFRVNIDGGGFSVLKNFTGGSDGGSPAADDLALDGTTLYGTTGGGGSNNFGVLFKMNTDGRGYTVLKSFNGGSDGRTPAGLEISGTTLYGTTYSGGSSGQGTVFRISTDGSGFTVLENFTSGNDGGLPLAGPVLSGTTLYGTTSYNYSGGYGTVFKLNTDGSGFAVLKQFSGTDGNQPRAGLVSSGTTLYGTTYYGGSTAVGWAGYGTVFEVNTNGSGFDVLKNFGSGGDGANPFGDLVLSGSTLYGTTRSGGISNYGTVFQVSTEGSHYTVLKRFRGSDGANPVAGLVLAGTTLYGTALQGGSSNRGVVFALALPICEILSPPISQTAEIGSSVAFTAQTGSAPSMRYQWFFNGTNVISGATTNSCLDLTNLQPSQAGAYTVVVTNAFGAVTSAPAMLSVIPPVERRIVPALTLIGQPESSLNLQDAEALGPSPNWVAFDNVALTNTSQWYFDLSTPLPPQRFYRAWQPGPSSVAPALDLHMVPALTLTGTVGSPVRVDYINQFGPIDAWVTLDTVTLTNTSQLYFDVSTIGQPPRLWRLVPLP